MADHKYHYGEESGDTRRIRLADKMTGVIDSLEALAQLQVSKKIEIERRWLDDLRQFHGKYDAETVAKLKAAKKSQIFVKLTRSKTNTWEARLWDMLFPTDDKNWGISPTPSAELSTALKDGSEQARSIQEEAIKRSSAMEIEIDDQLVECGYNIKSRDVIHDACVIGSGVLKGPLASGKMRRKWQDQGEEGYQLGGIPDSRPEFVWVDPWNYFPDMNARRKDECEFEFERHLLNKKGLRKLAKEPGFIIDAVREVMMAEPRDAIPDYIQQVRSIVNDGQSLDPMYLVWEYHGSLEGEELRALCECLDKEEYLEDIDDDPLKEVPVVIWFCQGKVLKVGLHSLDSQESLYSVFNLEKDDSSIFGFGVPYMMRDSQKSLNSAWRMIMDNSALSTGPQVVVNRDIIEPMDGDWNLTPRKIWFAKLRNGQGLDHAFKTYSINSHQEELLQVINVAKQFSDDETNLPLVAQGESGSHQTQTSGGMSMLMNSVNVVFRRVVRNFDDDMTTPNIRRIYDFNMQFSDKEHIKGDYEVKALGSSVLLVREVQAQNLMAMALQFSAHPVLGPLTKSAALYRSLVQAHMLPADSIVMTDEEIKQREAEERDNPPPPNSDILTLQLKKELAQMQGDIDVAIANIERDTAMVKLAEQKNMQIEDIRARFGIAQMTTQSKERMFAGELGVKRATGEGI